MQKKSKIDKRKVALYPSSKLVSSFEKFFDDETRDLKNLFEENIKD